MPDKTLGEIGLLKRKNEIKETKELFATRERDITPPGGSTAVSITMVRDTKPIAGQFRGDSG